MKITSSLFILQYLREKSKLRELPGDHEKRSKNNERNKQTWICGRIGSYDFRNEEGLND